MEGERKPCRLQNVAYLSGERVWRTTVRNYDAVMEALQGLPGLDVRVDGLHAVPRLIVQVCPFPEKETLQFIQLLLNTLLARSTFGSLRADHCAGLVGGGGGGGSGELCNYMRGGCLCDLKGRGGVALKCYISSRVEVFGR
jgi:hypothetical protein